eukprot:6465770-Prymnesium_polylepis.1
MVPTARPAHPSGASRPTRAAMRVRARRAPGGTHRLPVPSNRGGRWRAAARSRGDGFLEAQAGVEPRDHTLQLVAQGGAAVLLQLDPRGREVGKVGRLVGGVRLRQGRGRAR